jgi:hypothetical protein
LEPIRNLDQLVIEPTIPDRVMSFGDGAAVFWQIVFGTMLLPGFDDPVCLDCGKPLTESASGRRSKAERCRRCRYAKWWAGVPIEVRRQRERDKKRAQRARIKGE